MGKNTVNVKSPVKWVSEDKEQIRLRVEIAYGTVSLGAVNELEYWTRLGIADRGTDWEENWHWIDCVRGVVYEAHKFDILTDEEVNKIITNVIIPCRRLIRESQEERDQ